MSRAGALTPQGTQTLKSKNITITSYRTDEYTAHVLLRATLNHLKARLKANKTWLSAPTCSNGKTFFIKSTELSSLPSRTRVTFNLKRRNGLHDWPIAELLNNIKINSLTEQAPKLIGHAIRTGRSGLAKDTILIFEYLHDHIDGLLWVKNNPSKTANFITSTLNLITSLNNQGIIHLDLWARNVMLPEKAAAPLKLIDLENCIIGQTDFPSETLGFQFGFLYHHTLKNHITEKDYDFIVKRKISTEGWLDHSKFEKTYQHFKHSHAGRKDRQLIIKFGKIQQSTKTAGHLA
jgi:hypothetical protein